MITYEFLQIYWWCIISLLGGLLVFLMFVQGGNTLLAQFRNDPRASMLILNSTGRKWEFTFTTLVTFGGAFFASFPLFYSTSFGGAYWLWMLLLVSFVVQAVSYEFHSRRGNVLGGGVYRGFLVFNGFMAPFLVGVAVSTFFYGADFTVSRDAMANSLMPVVSSWANPWHGLEAIATVPGLLLGLAVFFLARCLGCLYIINNVSEPSFTNSCRRILRISAVPFVLFFVTFVVLVLLKDGATADAETGIIQMEAYKYSGNFTDLPVVAAIFVLGVLLVLYGIIRSFVSRTYFRGIWFAGAGTVLAVTSLLLVAGLNGTAYYPSNADLQSSLTIANSCSSEFTLSVMAAVSLLVPVVLAYIAVCWYKIDKRKLTAGELDNAEHKY